MEPENLFEQRWYQNGSILSIKEVPKMETQKTSKNVQIPKWKPKIFLNKGGTKMETIFLKKRMATQKRPNSTMEAENLFKQRWYQNGTLFPTKRFPKWKPKNVQIPKWKPKIFLNKGGTKMEAFFS